MKVSVHKVSRSSLEENCIQTQNGSFSCETQDLQPYGLQRHLPTESMAVVLQSDNQSRRSGILGYIEKLYELKEGEVLLYSEHGQVLYYKDDGSLHLEAAGKLSLHSDEEDLYSLLKDLLTAIKGLTTAKIDTEVNGGSVAVPGGSSTVAKAEGTNPGVGLSQNSSQKLDEIAQRLDKLLQKGKKPESAQKQQEQQQKREQQQQKVAQNTEEQQQSQKDKGKQDKANKIGVFELELGAPT